LCKSRFPECRRYAVVPHPVFALHATFQLPGSVSCCCFRSSTNQAVLAADRRRDVTDAPKIDGLPLVLTLVLEVAELMVKLFDCELAELL